MLELPKAERDLLWKELAAIIERYRQGVDQLPVAPDMDPSAVRAFLSGVDFQSPVSPAEALSLVEEGMTRYQMQVPHPGYMGLFNPNVSTMGVAGDTLAAAFNSQLAAWSHSPFGVEVELILLRAIAGKMGLDPATAEGVFTTGGMEANHTALITALYRRFPEAKQKGLQGLATRPVLLVSEEGHHSMLKAARVCGLGDDALRLVPLGEDGRMSPEDATVVLRECAARGETPFLLVATAGTTNAGMVDDLQAFADLAGENNLWLHVDGAWGLAAALVPELKPLLTGLEKADSLTFDAHKFLSVPMGAGMFITRHSGVLQEVFGTVAAYMPRDAEGQAVTEFFNTSLQWSRRFIGLKLFLTLLTVGWQGYEAVIREQTAVGQYLRDQLQAGGWPVINDTIMPTLCFQGREPELQTMEGLREVCSKVVKTGRSWISTTLFAGKPVLRLTITNYRTSKEHADALFKDLNGARDEVLQAK